MCGQKVVDRKTSEEQMGMLGFKKTIDWLATAIVVRWYGHVLRRVTIVFEGCSESSGEWQEKARTTGEDLKESSEGGEREDWFEEE